MDHETLNLREVIVFLFAAGIVVPVVRRMKISPVLGFLIVGVVIGPYGLARFADVVPQLKHVLITDLEGVRALAELGVVFLLFMIGLELSFDRLWAMRQRVFGLGGAQIVVTSAVIGSIAMAFGNPLPTSLVLGASFALSSTAIVMQLLIERRRMGTATGRLSFAILLCQDLAVLPILLLVGTFAATGSDAVFAAFALAMGGAILAVLLIIVVGRFVIRPVFRFVGGTDSKESFLACVLLVIVGTALVTEAIGLSMALGAFLVGLLLAETEYRHEIEVDIEPFKGLLLGLFYISIGMSIDVLKIAAEPVLILMAVVGLYAIKTVIIYFLARLFAASQPVALETGLLLGQSGEFAFLVVGMAFGLGLMPEDTAQFMLIVAALTMVVTPIVAHFARSLARGMEAAAADREGDEPDLPLGLSGHVVVVGYGRVGQMIGSVLDRQEVPYIGLDRDAGLVANFRSSGTSVFYGDGSRQNFLRKFGVENAAALVVTMDNPAAVEHVVANAHKHWPDLPVFARARDREHAARLTESGAREAVPETIEASLQLGIAVLQGIGVTERAARHSVATIEQTEEQYAEPDATR